MKTINGNSKVFFRRNFFAVWLMRYRVYVSSQSFFHRRYIIKWKCLKDSWQNSFALTKWNYERKVRILIIEFSRFKWNKKEKLGDNLWLFLQYILLCMHAQSPWKKKEITIYSQSVDRIVSQKTNSWWLLSTRARGVFMRESEKEKNKIKRISVYL